MSLDFGCVTLGPNKMACSEGRVGRLGHERRISSKMGSENECLLPLPPSRVTCPIKELMLPHVPVHKISQGAF